MKNYIMNKLDRWADGLTQAQFNSIMHVAYGLVTLILITIVCILDYN
jgi:hypothetical protein